MRSFLATENRKVLCLVCYYVLNFVRTFRIAFLGADCLSVALFQGIIHRSRSGGHSLVVRCSDEQCPWIAQFTLHSYSGRRTFYCDRDRSNFRHSELCPIVHDTRGLSPKALASMPEFQTIIKDSPKSPTAVIQNIVDLRLNINVLSHTVQRARRFVLGEDVDQANQALADIGAVAAAYLSLNPGAVVDLTVDSSNKLKYWFVAFDNSDILCGIQCVLFCDGGHIKNPACRRVVLAISALDLENRVIILALALVATESTESWTYMLHQFSRTAVGIRARSGAMVLMSDRDGGLRSAAKSVFPCTYLRFCILHVIKNMEKARIRGDFRLLIKIARTGSIEERDRLMIDLQRSSPLVVSWLRKNLRDIEWQLAELVQKGFAVQGAITNNVAESTMSKLLRPGSDLVLSLREMTPGPMFQEAMHIFSRQAQLRRYHCMELSRRAGSGMKLHQFTLYALRMYMKEQNESKYYRVEEQGPKVFAVKRKNPSVKHKDSLCIAESADVARTVKVNERGNIICTCCSSQQYGRLCRHIQAVVGKKYRELGFPRYAGIGNAWESANYIRAFGSFQAPAPHTEQIFQCLQQTSFPRKVEIPPPVPQRGRLKKARRKSALERDRAGILKREGLPPGTVCVVCSICRQLGHNMRTCPILRTDN